MIIVCNSFKPKLAIILILAIKQHLVQKKLALLLKAIFKSQLEIYMASYKAYLNV
jgi:hypothetical protein